jgi:hypothetical protein
MCPLCRFMLPAENEEESDEEDVAELDDESAFRC